MKIYIEDYKVSNITNVLLLKKFNDYFRKSREYFEIFSDEGIYNIENDKIYLLNETYIDDKEKRPKKIIDYFNHQANVNIKNILVDYSVFKKEEVYQLPTDHISLNTVLMRFSMCEKSIVEFVIKGYYDKKEIQIDGNNIAIANNYLNDDKYKDLVITDFYFETKREMDIEDMNLREDVEFFVKMLK